MLISPFQFIIIDKESHHPIENGVDFSFNNVKIIIHTSNVKHCVINRECLFFGECFDFENPTFSNQDVVDSLLGLSFEDKLSRINKLTGFFIFVLFQGNQAFIINDAAGQLETYIYQKKDELIIASQPNLINCFLKDTDCYDQNAPAYIIENKVIIFNKTPFENIEKLLPNFYYHIDQRKCLRFFPVSELPFKSVDEIADEVKNILEKTIESISHRGKSAIALTAGWDSRMLFATSLCYGNIDYYVLNHRTEDARVDVDIAEKITNEFSKKIQIIDYDLSTIKLSENDKNRVWKDNVRTQKIAHLMNHHFPNCYLINGNISEVARNFYDPLPSCLTDLDLAYILGLQEGGYEKKIIRNWRTKLKNIPILDAIYWEHKMPNWAGSSKSISNLHNIVISPFNNRYLLNLLLSSKRKERDKHFHKIYADVLTKIDKRLMDIPFNPTRKQNKIILMKKMKIYTLYRYLFFKLRKLNF